MQQHYKPIETKVGTLVGRDAIYLDALKYSEKDGCLTVTGTFNGHLSSLPLDEFVSYQLVFTGVNSFTVIDGDVAEDDGVSCFDEVLNSVWKASLGEEVSDTRHYSLATYDKIINVLCVNYELTYPE